MASTNTLSSSAKRRHRAKVKSSLVTTPALIPKIPEGKELNRQQREELSIETRKICAAGSYVNSEGREIKLADVIERCKKTSVLYRGAKLDELHALATLRSKFGTSAPSHEPRIEVTGESTIEACLRLSRANSYHDDNLTIIAQNFASANNPGGGFLTGAKAQEESLCYASALYNVLSDGSMSKYYEENKAVGGRNFYGDAKIWTPDCPVFRDHHNNLLEVPIPVSFVSCPAVNHNCVPTGSMTSAMSWKKRLPPR